MKPIKEKTYSDLIFKYSYMFAYIPDQCLCRINAAIIDNIPLNKITFTDFFTLEDAEEYKQSGDFRCNTYIDGNRFVITSEKFQGKILLEGTIYKKIFGVHEIDFVLPEGFSITDGLKTHLAKALKNFDLKKIEDDMFAIELDVDYTFFRATFTLRTNSVYKVQGFYSLIDSVIPWSPEHKGK